MKTKSHTVVILFLVILPFIAACSGQNNDNLTRVDIQKVNQDGKYEDTVLITDNETIVELETIFKQIKWEPNVQAEMARKEDVLVTLFYTFDENMPERLYKYRIWFNGNGNATIISNNEEEGYGSLNKEDTLKLKYILLN